jgi:glycosyltransferase involved in cell wall biosynthesis
LSPVSILFVAKNRKQFTEWSLTSLLGNTNWDLVEKLWLNDDGSVDGTDLVLEDAAHFVPIESEVRRTNIGSPISIANDAVFECKTQFIAKIDNDTLLPPGWLDVAMEVIAGEPKTDLVGLEYWGLEGGLPYRPAPAAFVGGLFLARRDIFQGKKLPESHGIYYGWQDWQNQQQIKRSWIQPSIPVVLLDRIPVEPCASLTKEYEAKGWQRPWERYGPEQAHLWNWFFGKEKFDGDTVLCATQGVA